MNLLNLLIAYVLLHLLASNLGIEFHSQIASNGPKNVENNSYVKDESTVFRLSTNHTSSIDIATATIYIIKEICKLRLIPFGIRSQEMFSDIACLRIPYQSCIVLFGIFFSGTPASNRRELRLHLNVVPTGVGVFKSRYILLHKYVNRIMITYL